MSLSFEDYQTPGYSEKELISMVRAKLKAKKVNLPEPHMSDSRIIFELQDAKLRKKAFLDNPVGVAVREVLSEINSLRFDMLRR